MAKRGKPEDGEGAANAAPQYPVAISDFRESKHYAAPRSVSRWRWEFLRRSEEYQRKADQHGWAPNVTPDASCHEFGLRRYYDYRSPYQLGMAYSEPGYRIHLPTLDDLKRWRELPGFDAYRALRRVLGTLTELQDGVSALLVVDRSLPLSMQFDRLEEQLKASAKFSGEKFVFQRERPADWLKYLRILDGQASGASLDEIACAVYPEASNVYPDYSGKKSVVAALKRAHEMQTSFARRRFAAAQER